MHVVDAGETVLPGCEGVCCLRRFDLVANGGASLTLRYERAPFPTLHRTVWLPWNVFHVMDTVVMKREENDIPSCYLTGLIKPNPQILATPLSTFYKSSPEDSPIVPETQVRMQHKFEMFFSLWLSFQLVLCKHGATSAIHISFTIHFSFLKQPNSSFHFSLN